MRWQVWGILHFETGFPELVFDDSEVLPEGLDVETIVDCGFPLEPTQ